MTQTLEPTASGAPTAGLPPCDVEAARALSALVRTVRAAPVHGLPAAHAAS